MSHPVLLERILRWAQAHEQARALILTGSMAQPGARIDPLSDLDLELVVHDVAAMMATGPWWAELGEVWATQVIDAFAAASTQAYPLVGVIYAGGATVDFTLIDAARFTEMAQTQQLDRVYAPGYRVLWDPERVADGLPVDLSSARTQASQPSLTQQELRAVADAFWFEALRVPKYLIRGELWEAKSREWTMKQHLLLLIEWHAAVLTGRPLDEYRKGRHLGRWADPRVWQEAHDVFGRFDAADSWRAFLASVALFNRLAGETAGAAGLRYPSPADVAITEHLRTLAAS
jgi:aminoglycoside 6-adenylyltransferase